MIAPSRLYTFCDEKDSKMRIYSTYMRLLFSTASQRQYVLKHSLDSPNARQVGQHMGQACLFDKNLGNGNVAHEAHPLDNRSSKPAGPYARLAIDLETCE